MATTVLPPDGIAGRAQTTGADASACAQGPDGIPINTSRRAVKVSEELWFAANALQGLRARLLAHLQQHGSIDAQGFKELTGQSRKFTIPLAEWFDKERVTLRVGDKRVLRKERER